MRHIFHFGYLWRYPLSCCFLLDFCRWVDR